MTTTIRKYIQLTNSLQRLEDKIEQEERDFASGRISAQSRSQTEGLANKLISDGRRLKNYWDEFNLETGEFTRWAGVAVGLKDSDPKTIAELAEQTDDFNGRVADFIDRSFFRPAFHRKRFGK